MAHIRLTLNISYHQISSHIIKYHQLSSTIINYHHINPILSHFRIHFFVASTPWDFHKSPAARWWPLVAPVALVSKSLVMVARIRSTWWHFSNIWPATGRLGGGTSFRVVNGGQCMIISIHSWCLINGSYLLIPSNIWLVVGGALPPLKNDGQMFVSWDDEIPNWMESHQIHVPNHSDMDFAQKLGIDLLNMGINPLDLGRNWPTLGISWTSDIRWSNTTRSLMVTGVFVAGPPFLNPQAMDHDGTMKISMYHVAKYLGAHDFFSQDQWFHMIW